MDKRMIYLKAHPEITNPEEFGQKMDQEYEDKYNKCEELIVLEDSENLKKRCRDS